MIRLKQLLIEQDLKPYIKSTNWLGFITWNYPAIEKCNNPKDIAAILKKAHGIVQDDEAAAEAAFIGITNRSQAQAVTFYVNVSNALGQDPYTYVQSYMDTSIKYHKRSIDNSASILQKAANAVNTNIEDPSVPRSVENTSETNSLNFVREFPPIVIGKYGRDKLREYKKMIQRAFDDAKNWWVTYLTSPKTREKFDKNWNSDLDTWPNAKPGTMSVDIFPTYIAALKKLKLKIYHNETDGNNAYANNVDYYIDKFRQNYNIANRYDVNVNIYNTIQRNRSEVKNILVHEIQHILDHFHPFNPPAMRAKVGLADEPVLDAISKNLSI